MSQRDEIRLKGLDATLTRRERGWIAETLERERVAILELIAGVADRPFLTGAVTGLEVAPDIVREAPNDEGAGNDPVGRLRACDVGTKRPR